MSTKRFVRCNQGEATMKFWDLPAGHVQLVRRYFRNGEHHVVVVVDGQTKEFPSIFFDEVK